MTPVIVGFTAFEVSEALRGAFDSARWVRVVGSGASATQAETVHLTLEGSNDDPPKGRGCLRPTHEYAPPCGQPFIMEHRQFFEGSFRRLSRRNILLLRGAFG